MRLNKQLHLLFLLAYSISIQAGDVDIQMVALYHQSQNEYAMTVQLQHDDTGWEHYADAWRVVDDAGNILGTRTLLHPHVDEQPFARGLNNIKIKDELETLYIEAHDKVHGWTEKRLMIDLTKMQNGRLIVRAE
tara:strand:- start:1055 stop:1456 length:402 start_codon:yes stop_codon:yes gene_type:complete